MRSRVLKSAFVPLTAAALLFAGSTTAYAKSAYEQVKGSAGSTSVTVEAGFNGNKGYASVTASDYVDAKIDAIIGYYNEDFELITKWYSGGFDQRKYGSIGTTCKADIEYTSCRFQISSDDGTWTRACYAD